MAQLTIKKATEAMLIISIVLFITIITLISFYFYLRQRERYHRLPCTSALQTYNLTTNEHQNVHIQPEPQPPQPLLPSPSTTSTSTASHSPAPRPPPPCHKEAPIAQVPAIPLAELSVYQAAPEPLRRTEPVHPLLINKPLRSHPIERRGSADPFRSRGPPHLNEPFRSLTSKSRLPAEPLHRTESRHQTEALVSPISPLQATSPEPLISHKTPISPLYPDPDSASESTETEEQESESSDWPLRSSLPTPTSTSATSSRIPIPAPLFTPLHTPTYVTASGRPSSEVLSPITESSLEGVLSERTSEMDVEIGMSWFDSEEEQEEEDVGRHVRRVSMGHRKLEERDGRGKLS